MLRKKCGKCGEKTKNSYTFCPNCGVQLRKQEDWGFLGKNDFNSFEGNNETPFEGLINKMLGSALKILEKEIQKEMKPNSKNSSPKMRLMINGKEINSKENIRNAETQFLPIDFSPENLEKWKKLKKEEPISNLRREEDKINYEIDVPEVKSIKDISIVKLENSLEIRAVGENKAYLKRVPIDLPLRKYSLIKGLLVLEMDASGRN